MYLDEHRYVIKVLGMYYCSYVSDLDPNDLPVSEVLICSIRSIWVILHMRVTCQVPSDSLSAIPPGCYDCRLDVAIPAWMMQPESCSTPALSYRSPLS